MGPSHCRQLGTTLRYATAQDTDVLVLVSAEGARSIGLVDQVGPRDPAAYRAWLTELAEWYASQPETRRLDNRNHPAPDHGVLAPDAYETRELAEMSHDMFADRSGFAAARQAFVAKAKPTHTPERLKLSSARTAEQDVMATA